MLLGIKPYRVQNTGLNKNIFFALVGIIFIWNVIYPIYIWEVLLHNSKTICPCSVFQNGSFFFVIIPNLWYITIIYQKILKYDQVQVAKLLMYLEGNNSFPQPKIKVTVIITILTLRQSEWSGQTFFDFNLKKNF